MFPQCLKVLLLAIIHFVVLDVASSQNAKVKLATAIVGTGYGKSVSVDGERIAVGAPFEGTAGTVYFIRREGGTWVSEDTVVPSDGAYYDQFGSAVSLSGTYAIIGAPDDDDNGTSSGSAYIFERSGSTWIEEAKITPSDGQAYETFGSAVSISDSHAIVGPYIFRREGDSWIQATKLRPSGDPEEHFGCSVSMYGDFAIVGATSVPDWPQSPGSAYIFKRDGVHWVEEGVLLAGDGADGDAFGHSVSIWEDRVIVGAPYNDDERSASGSAYIFKRGDFGWSEEAKLTASDPGRDDRFGFAVAISGDHVMVGAPVDDDIAKASGASYFFKHDSLGWFEVTKLIEDGDHEESLLGSVVSISGDHAVVGTGIGGGNPHFPTYGYAFAYSGLDPVGPVTALVTVSPASGNGMFDYSFELVNSADTTLMRDIWIETRGPGGQTRTGQVMYGRSLGAGEMFVMSGTHNLGVGSLSGTYRFWVKVGRYPDFTTSSGSAPYTKTGPLKIESLAEKEEIPSSLELIQNHPNPFNPSTTISYALDQDVWVRLKVFSVLGEEVVTLVDGLEESGLKSVTFDAAGIPSGTYFYRLEAGNVVQTKKLILMK